MKIYFSILYLALLAGSFLSAKNAHAAAIFLSPPAAESRLSEELSFDVKIDSEGESFNAAQAVVRFPKDTLKVSSLDKTNSLFSFWLEEPNFSNSEGIISFIGGTPYGVAGSSVQILKIVFQAKGSGGGNLTISDAAVTASDGSGTSIFSKVLSAAFLIAPEEVTPKPPVSAPFPEAVSKEPEIEPEAAPTAAELPILPSTPMQIVREAVPTGKLPAQPSLTIPLYPDSSKWHNLISPFNVCWDLPLDVTDISTAINSQPAYNPAQSEGLFDNKTFPHLQDGVHYLHVRFKNDVGWGANGALPAGH